ncbi:hypothetical protein LDENG_00141930 [Lucifuga dentata]|nr:hypothetical protein LDENG_00141930 [Lucifuga dentata]
MARNNFESTRAEVERLMKRIRSAEADFKAPGCFTMEGYLYIQEKRPLGSVWTRYYCTYEKSSKMFTMSNTEARPASRQNGVVNGAPEMFRLRSCVRRKTESIDKRFCFDIEVVERHGVITLQALSESNRRLWMEAMDGKEPIYTLPSLLSKKEETFLNEAGFNFVKRCIELVDARGIGTLGLYRTGGVNSKVQRLMASAFASSAPPDFQVDADMWDNKTITSGLKDYFRCLAEPLLTYRLHKDFIKAAKSDDQNYRVRAIHALIHKLPDKNRSMLDILTNHLLRVSTHSDQNLMTVSNLGMIFGPTLMRSQEETVAAMMNIKFQNIVVEIIIENRDKIFGEAPDLSVPSSQTLPTRSTPRRKKAICLSSGKRKPRLYAPALCLADNDSDTFSSSPSMTPMGSQESLSSHSSEKNGQSPASPPLSPAAEPVSSSSSSSTTPTSPPAASSCSPSNQSDQRSQTIVGADPQLTSSASWTSSQAAPNESTSVCSSTSSLHSAADRAERSSTIRGNSSATSLSSVMEPRTSSVSTSSSSSQHASADHISSLREAQAVHRASSTCSLQSTHSVDQTESCTSSTLTETRTTEPTSPSQQRRTTFKRASSSSSSSSSLFPCQISTSSSLTSLHISEDFKSCHGSVQSLMSVDPQDLTLTRKVSHIRSGSDANVKHPAASASNRYQRPGSLLLSKVPLRDSAVFSSALDVFPTGREAKALYSCEAEHSHELSFPQGALFSNVCSSVEPGWLQATYNGRTGLIPENYITYI